MEPVGFAADPDPFPSTLRLVLPAQVGTRIVGTTVTVRVWTQDRARWKSIVTIAPQNDSVDVRCPDGDFLIEAVLGDGRRVRADGSIEKETREVVLEPQSSDHAAGPARSHLQAAGDAPASLRDAMGPTGRLRFWQHTAAGGWKPLDFTVEQKAQDALSIRVDLPPTPDRLHSVLVEAAGPALPESVYSISPCSWRHDRNPLPTEFVIDCVAVPGGKPALRMRPTIPEGPLRDVSRLLLQNDLEVIEQIGPSLATTAEALFATDDDNSVLGAGGALALLRVRRLDLMHDWTLQLAENFPELPDGQIIRAWHLLFGHVAGAALETDGGESPLARLLRAAELSVPAYTQALRLLVDGLRLFSRTEPLAAQALEQTTPLLWSADPQAIFTSFEGHGPQASVQQPPWLLRWSNPL